MNLRNLIVAGVVLISTLFSCSRKDDRVDYKTHGDTYASISLFLGGDAFRTEENDNEDFNHIGEWVGNDEIKTVDVYLVGQAVGDIVSSGQYDFKDFSVVTGDDSNQTKLIPKKAIKTTAGDKKVYVLVNAPQKMREKLALTDKADFERAWTEAYTAYEEKVSTSDKDTYARVGQEGIAQIAKQNGEKDIIMMSNNQDYLLKVKPNITQDDAKSGVDNQALVYVKRAAARVIVTTEASSFEIKDGDLLLGTVSDVTYAVAQGERKLYIQQKREGAPSVVKTPAYVVKETTIENMDENYDYSDLYRTNRSAAVSAKGSATVTPAEVGGLTSPAFMLEANHKRNTTSGNTPANYDGDFRVGNTPYVLIRAKFSPASGALAENNSMTELSTDGTFYVGAVNGRVYTKKEYVTNPAKGGIVGQKHRTYKAGKVLYYAYVNPDQIDKNKVLNAPVFRNNVYHIHVSGIKAIGHNWNPVFPEDPDTPNPKNPDPKPNDPNEDPNKPVDPDKPLPNQDTYMSVSVSILKWNVHSYKITLNI